MWWVDVVGIAVRVRGEGEWGSLGWDGVVAAFSLAAFHLLNFNTYSYIERHTHAGAQMFE